MKIAALQDAVDQAGGDVSRDQLVKIAREVDKAQLDRIEARLNLVLRRLGLVMVETSND